MSVMAVTMVLCISEAATVHRSEHVRGIAGNHACYSCPMSVTTMTTMPFRPVRRREGSWCIFCQRVGAYFVRALVPELPARLEVWVGKKTTCFQHGVPETSFGRVL